MATVASKRSLSFTEKQERRLLLEHGRIFKRVLLAKDPTAREAAMAAVGEHAEICRAQVIDDDRIFGVRQRAFDRHERRRGQ